MVWTLVKDTQPRIKDRSYLCWFVGDSFPKGEYCFAYFDGDGWSDGDGSLNAYITHWMELPEQPTII